MEHEEHEEEFQAIYTLKNPHTAAHYKALHNLQLDIHTLTHTYTRTRARASPDQFIHPRHAAAPQRHGTRRSSSSKSNM